MTVLRLQEIDSTNLEARRRIEDGEAGPLWIIADHQTAGRGRFEREWVSPPGNLHTSLILKPGRPLKEVAVLSLLAGVVVHQVVVSFVPDRQVLLKWPNDVLVEGAKTAGILLESVGPQNDPTLIVGMGINVASAPEGMPYSVTCLTQHRGDVELEAVFKALKSRFEALLAVYMAEGFQPIREQWLASSVDPGTPMQVRLSNKTLKGSFGGLDETGALILTTTDGPLAITAGDVFFAPTEHEITE